MYIAQEIADRIKKRAKAQKVLIRDMLAACGLNVNTVSEMAKGKQISYVSFARIADYLDCSVDYLLGRTDVPEINK